MASRPENSSAGNFARGAEIWMHQTRLFLVAVWTVILMSLVIGIMIAGIYFFNAATPTERYAWHRHGIAQIRDALDLVIPPEINPS